MTGRMVYDPNIAILHLIRLMLNQDSRSIEMFMRKYLRRAALDAPEGSEERQMALELQTRLPPESFLR